MSRCTCEVDRNGHRLVRLAHLCFELIRRELAAGQFRARSPRRHRSEEMADLPHGRLRQLSVRRNLAAIDGEQRGLAAAVIENQFVIARDILGLVGVIVIKRAHSRK